MDMSNEYINILISIAGSISRLSCHVYIPRTTARLSRRNLRLVRGDQTGSTCAYSFSNRCLHLYLELPWSTGRVSKLLRVMNVDDAIDKYLGMQ